MSHWYQDAMKTFRLGFVMSIPFVSQTMLRLGWDLFTAGIILITAFGAAAAIHHVLETVRHETKVVTHGNPTRER